MRPTPLVILLTAALSASPTFAQAPVRERTVTVHKGTEAKINFHENHKNSGSFCTSYGIPELKLVTPPKNGTVRFGPTKVTPLGCPNEIDGIGVFYTPNTGFVGQDRVVYDKPPQGSMMNVGNEGTNEITINVR